MSTDKGYSDPAMTGSGQERLAHDAYLTIDTPIIHAVMPHLEPLLSRKVWEPACGKGHISTILIEKGYDVWSSDINNWGYGHVQDFLKAPVPHVDERIWNIVTNPPYEKEICEAFVSKALQHIKDTKQCAAFLLRAEWDYGVTRRRFFADNPMFYKKVVLHRRPKWFEKKEGEKAQSPRFAYAWFIWRGDNNGAEPLIAYAR